MQRLPGERVAEGLFNRANWLALLLSKVSVQHWSTEVAGAPRSSVGKVLHCGPRSVHLTQQVAAHLLSVSCQSASPLLQISLNVRGLLLLLFLNEV